MTAIHSDVIVVGAGVAGLSAAVALSAAGAKGHPARTPPLHRRPRLLLRPPRPRRDHRLPARQSSAAAPTSSTSAHQAGIADTIPLVRRSHIPRAQRPSQHHPNHRPHLPAPCHKSLSFLRAPMLNLRDKAAIATGLMHFLRGYPADDSESFANWLQRTGQTERAIRHFWEPIVVGALNDGFDQLLYQVRRQGLPRVLPALPRSRTPRHPRRPAQRVLRPRRRTTPAATDVDPASIRRRQPSHPTPDKRWQLQIRRHRLRTADRHPRHRLPPDPGPAQPLSSTSDAPD